MMQIFHKTRIFVRRINSRLPFFLFTDTFVGVDSWSAECSRSMYSALWALPIPRTFGTLYYLCSRPHSHAIFSILHSWKYFNIYIHVCVCLSLCIHVCIYKCDCILETQPFSTFHYSRITNLKY